MILQEYFEAVTDTRQEWKVKHNLPESTAVPHLLDMLDVSGCIITADAMSFQKEISEPVFITVERRLGGLFPVMNTGSQRKSLKKMRNKCFH